MDGHTSHVTWQFFDYCLEHNIIPLCLPPHSTHLLQPLDVGLFGPLQKHYGSVLDEWLSESNLGIHKGTFYPYVYILIYKLFALSHYHFFYIIGNTNLVLGFY